MERMCLLLPGEGGPAHTQMTHRRQRCRVERRQAVCQGTERKKDWLQGSRRELWGALDLGLEGWMKSRSITAEGHSKPLPVA